MRARSRYTGNPVTASGLTATGRGYEARCRALAEVRLLYLMYTAPGTSRRPLPVGFVLVFAALHWLSAPGARAEAPVLPPGFCVVAHRGVVTGDVLENSLQSLELTIARGYSHVEVDVRLTKDGVPVCHHDPDLKRSLGVDAKISALTLAELRAIATADEVPALEAFCARAEGRIDLMVDVKETPEAQRPAMIEGIRAALGKHGLLSDALFIGVPTVGAAFIEESRVCWRGSLRRAKEFFPPLENPGEHYFIFNHGDDFTAEEVRGFHALGLKVIVSINTQHYMKGDPIAQGRAHIQSMLEYGVDGLQIDSVYDDLLFGAAR